MSRRSLTAVLVLGAAALGTVGLFAVQARRLARASSARPKPADSPLPRVRSSTPEGLALWIVDDSTKVSPGDALGTPWAGVPIRLEGARGETVSFQVALAAHGGSPRVEVEFSEGAAPGKPIPRSTVEVFLESTLTTPAGSAKAVALPPGEYPDPLLPLWEDGWGGRPVASPFALEPDRNRVLWVDLKIPRGAAGDHFTGALRLQARAFPPVELPLELTVYPFEIPVAPHLTAWVPLYENRLHRREDLRSMGQKEAVATIQRYYRMAHEHRFVTQIAEEEPRLDWDQASGSLRSADWRDYDALNGPALEGRLFEDGSPPALWKVGGFMGWGGRPGVHPHFGGTLKTDPDLTPGHKRAITEYAREVDRHFRERGWSVPQVFMYMIDEPDFEKHPSLAGIVKAYGEAVHAAGTPLRHLVTIGPQDSPIPLGGVDIWATWGAGYYPRRMQARQKLGEKAWFYQQHEPFVGGNCVNNEGLALRSWPWIAWRYRVDGLFLWVGNYWNEDPYRDAVNRGDGMPGNGVLFYPGALLGTLGLPAIHGPVSSFRMKALRRGLFDYEYFHLLRTLGGDPDPLVAGVVRTALNEHEVEPYWKHPLWRRPGDWSHDPPVWDRVRREVAQAIRKRLGQ